MVFDIDRDEPTEIYVDKIIHQTEFAVLCDIDGEEIWLPWSQIDCDESFGKIGDEGTIHIPMWLAEQNALA